MGLIEMSIILSLIMTIGHYLCLLSAYHEKVFQAREMIKKKEKKLSKQQYDELLEEVKETNDIRCPRLAHDNLPLKAAMLAKHVILTVLPAAVVHAVELIRLHIASRKEEVDEEPVAAVPRVRKARFQPALPDLTGETDDDEMVDVQNMDPHQSNMTALLTSEIKEWTQEEMLQLIKACKKLPVGTMQRWEKIAEMMSRSVDDVTKMSKSLRSGMIKLAPEVQTSVKQANAACVSDNDISCRDSDPGDSIQSWSQSEQRLLEEGLQKYHKGCDARWDMIAAYTGKSKVSCKLYLAIDLDSKSN